jgi:pre-mRNA-splicing helicase BRR2
VQAQLTAIDIMTYASSSGAADRFLNIEGEEAKDFEKRMTSSLLEPVLVACVTHGVGFIHEGMTKRDRDVVEALWRDEVCAAVQYKRCNHGPRGRR